MKRLLRYLLRLHLKRICGGWIVLGLVTLALGLGAFRIERRLDLFSLLPMDHPVVRASLEAGVGQQEILWLAAEGDAANLEIRQAWAEKLVEKLLAKDGVSLNGMSGEGRISRPVPVPGPMGASLWPPLLAAGSLLDGDEVVGRLLTEQGYALAPVLLGDRLAPLKDPAEIKRRLQAKAAALRTPDPARARLEALDPLGIRDLLPPENELLSRATRSVAHLPLKLRTGYLETTDGRFVLVPLVLDFPSSDAKSTARVLVWAGRGAEGGLPARVGKKDVEMALARSLEGPKVIPQGWGKLWVRVRGGLARIFPGVIRESEPEPPPGRPFALQATGAHAIAYWESQVLGREVLLSLLFSFVLIGIVYWIGFRTLAGYGYVVGPLLIGMIWALGLNGWILGRLNLMAAAFGAVLLGIGDDVGILLFSRYREERQGGRSKPMALRLALLGTGPGVVTGALATALAFLACTLTPFPGFRDLGLTAGLGLLACLASSFLILPGLLLALDRGKGIFAPQVQVPEARRSIRPWKLALTALLLLLAAWGARRLTWEEDLRRFRQAGNPALRLQETLGRTLGTGLQPLELQIPLDDSEHFGHRWNRIAAALRREGLPMPSWEIPSQEVRTVLGSETWYRRTLEEASRAGLDPVLLERPLEALRASAENPLAAPLSLQGLLPPPVSVRRDGPWNLLNLFHRPRNTSTAMPYLAIPISLPDAAQDRIEAEAKAVGVRMVGTRPLFRAVKEVAHDSLRQVIGLALAAVLVIVALFGRTWRFLLLALVPLAAGQLGVLGILGLTGEPLTFLSLVAVPITLGVSVDTAMNLLHRSRHEAGAAARVAKVNAVCAGTTLAGFGGLVFSGYRGLRGLGLAALGGVALALLVTQWLLPWMLEKWPLRDRSSE